MFDVLHVAINNACNVDINGHVPVYLHRKQNLFLEIMLYLKITSKQLKSLFLYQIAVILIVIGDCVVKSCPQSYIIVVCIIHKNET